MGANHPVIRPFLHHFSIETYWNPWWLGDPSFEKNPCTPHENLNWIGEDSGIVVPFMLWRIVESSPGNYVDVFGHLQRPSSVLILPDFKLCRTSVFVSCCVLLMLGLEFKFTYLAWQRDMPHVENKELTKRYKPALFEVGCYVGYRMSLSSWVKNLLIIRDILSMFAQRWKVVSFATTSFTPAFQAL